jgi:organic hydroperoxide reductase OsmC/OhrA
MADHLYATALHWTGSTSGGYRAYNRNHTVGPAGLQTEVSADQPFRGDPTRLNPEQLVVMAASSCQLLSFLALAAVAGVDVLEYHDHATAVMPKRDLPVRLTQITLRPQITVAAGADADKVEHLVHRAHGECYIANSLRSEIVLEPVITVGVDATA